MYIHTHVIKYYNAADITNTSQGIFDRNSNRSEVSRVITTIIRPRTHEDANINEIIA